MPKRKEPTLSDAEQRKRFEALARKSGATASTKEFRDTLRRIARPSDNKPTKRKP